MPGMADVLEVIHFSYPVLLLVIFMVAFAAQGVLSSASAKIARPTVTGPGGRPLPQNQLSREQKARLKQSRFSHHQELLFCWLSVGQISSFLANAANVIVHALAERENGGWWCGEATVVYLVASAFLYTLFLISLIDTSPAPTWAHLVTWTSALIGELLLFGLSAALYSSLHPELDSLNKTHKALAGPNEWEIFELCIDGLRILLLAATVAFYALFSAQEMWHARKFKAQQSNGPTENTPLLMANDRVINGLISNGLRGNGTPPNTDESISERSSNANSSNRHTPTNSNASNSPMVNGHSPNGVASNGHPANVSKAHVEPEYGHETAAFYRPTTAPSRSWWEYLQSYSLFFPYLWPSRSLKLKAIVVVCFMLTAMQRLVNILVPMQIGIVTNSFAKGGGIPWKEVSLLVAYKFLQGSSGVLGAARAMLWIPISQFSYQALATASFEHVHSLSLDFHLGKRTGEVISALNKGNAINTFLEQITFNVIPMLVDLFVAIVYFQIKFDAYFSLVFAIVTFWYMYLTIRMAQWRAEQRRKMTNADREEDAVKNDSLHSYETVKYFNAEAYEFKRYAETVRVFQKAEYKVLASLNLMNITQNMVFMMGLLVTAFICAWQVTTGVRDVGDFVALLVYMQQLQSPLNYFGTFYRNVQSAMISGERLLELFKEQPTVVDAKSALELHHCNGTIEFDDVQFSYDKRRPALEGLSFKCPAGTTTALVGESGGGKSTIFRLLFRFYNAEDGAIRVDGHDVRSVTIDSLRRHIGVVPQDTILFNETLMWNLRYANQEATDEDVYEACRAASIHDKIISSFPDGYNTKVGERGMKLSGGEKQRVAIARTILKNPKIIMLDEATAALDTETEQHIQEALTTLSAGRTMLVIAHRLSTITHADQIIVLHAGAVVESGTHHELLDKKGRYAAMWKRQIRAEQAATEAKRATDRAVALQKKAITITRPSSAGDGVDSGNASESDGDAALLAPNNTPENTKKSPSLSVADRADCLRITTAIDRRSYDDGKPPGHP